jgi:hypothetical protein
MRVGVDVMADVAEGLTAGLLHPLRARTANIDATAKTINNHLLLKITFFGF